jgi:peptidoglycan/LPS O-acetylase OafA/YrhL
MNTVLGAQLWWLSAACTVVLALGLAEVFTRLIEQPAHRLSQRTGGFFSQLVHRATDGGPIGTSELTTAEPAESTSNT